MMELRRKNDDGFVWQNMRRSTRKQLKSLSDPTTARHMDPWRTGLRKPITQALIIIMCVRYASVVPTK